MTRRIGMIVFLAAFFAALVGLSYAFYLLAGVLALGFARLGAPPEWGATIANLVTLMLVVLMVPGTLLSVAERKWSALMQNRIGCNRIRVFGSSLGGIPFLVADALKMLTKERFTPDRRTKFLFDLAPVLAFAPIFALFAIVPIGAPVALGNIVGAEGALGRTLVSLQVASPDAGLLYLFAIASLAVYGTSLAGWASNNKLALLGSVRAASQMIGYEVSLGLSLVGTMIAYQTLRLEEMALAQASFAKLGLLLQPVGFLVFFASAFAETKRAPFDLPEGESEIVGYFIEYSGMQFGLMFLSEFIEIVVVAGVITAVFLGGGHFWLFEQQARASLGPLWFAALGAGVFLAKMIALMWLQLTIRWLLPRFRYDQIQKLCWKILLPVSIANVFVTAAAVLLDPSLTLLAWIGVASIVAIAAVTAAASRAPAAASAAGHGHGDHADAAHAAAGH
ncbi:MAG TPA: complex I subunit 1 family protein [Anaeromyxobacter sp.]|nr:complex I subunit 1 family protein [Anaeromyxobacter sp.]